MAQAAGRTELVLGEALDEDGGQALGVEVGQVGAQLAAEGLAEAAVGGDRGDRLLSGLGQVQALGEERTDVEDLDAVVEQGAGEPVVLGLGALDPRDAVEQERAVVAGVRRRSSPPGRWRMTRRRRPVSESTRYDECSLELMIQTIEARGPKINFSLLTWID
ncbi:hypothetical protein GCM10029992_11340 [Glycomyces albus]